MIKKILFAAILFMAVVVNFSFSTNRIPLVTPTAKPVQKSVQACISLFSCTFCGGVIVNSGTTTLCLTSICSSANYICISFGTTIIISTGRYAVDPNTISVQYSSQQLRSQVNEAALLADFIAQVEADLNDD